MGHTCGAMGEPRELWEPLSDPAADTLVPPAARLLQGARLLLVQGDPVLTDALAQQLRALGASVGVTDAAGRGLLRLAFLDPQIVLFDRARAGEEAGVLKELRAHPRLRWATVLGGFSWDALWPPSAPGPGLLALGRQVAALTEADRTLHELAASCDAFTAPIEPIGPARVLRALAGASDQVLQLTLSAGAAVATVEICGELVVGATFRDHAGGPVHTGAAALARVLTLRSGQGEVVRRELATAMTLMAPLSWALDAAQLELSVEAAGEDPRQLAASVASSPALPRSPVDGHALFDLGADEVTAKRPVWSDETSPQQPPLVAGEPEARASDGADETTQRVALPADQARPAPGLEGAREATPTRPRCGTAPLPISSPDEKTALASPARLVDSAPPPPPLVDSAPPQAPTLATSSPPPAPPHADAVGAHRALEVESSGNAPWIGAGALLLVAALVGGVLVLQGGGPSAVSPEPGGVASAPAPTEGRAVSAPNDPAEPPADPSEPAEPPEPAEPSEPAEPPEPVEQAPREEGEERAAPDHPAEAELSELLEPPAAPALFGPGDIEGGSDRPRADALLAAAADARAHQRLRYLYAAARADRRNPHVAEALARHFLDTRGPRAAEPWAREAVRLRRRRPRYRVLLGDVLRAAGDVAGARHAYEEAAELGDETAQARLQGLTP